MSRTIASLWAMSLAPLVTISPAVDAAPPKFQQALPGYRYVFPRDHGSHPAYATEWWYYTGHLQTADGRRFGYQLTWFRTAIAPRVQRRSAWATRDIFFAHFALTDQNGQQFFFSDRIGRGNLGLAGASSGDGLPQIFIGDWKLQFQGNKGDRQTFRAAAQSDATATAGKSFALDLRQIALKPPTIQGENGVSQKATGLGRASHYYSFTHLQTAGTLTLGNQKLKVTGQSWFDHEYGSNQLDANHVGWDWFSIQLKDGRELMLYRLRLKNGGDEPASSGTLIEKDGRTRHLKLSDFQLTPQQNWKSDQTGATYPTHWKVELPKLKISLDIAAVLEAQELSPKRSGANRSYWEGSIAVSGSEAGQPLNGVGYLEMTGYASAFKNTF